MKSVSVKTNDSYSDKYRNSSPEAILASSCRLLTAWLDWTETCGRSLCANWTISFGLLLCLLFSIYSRTWKVRICFNSLYKKIVMVEVWLKPNPIFSRYEKGFSYREKIEKRLLELRNLIFIKSNFGKNELKNCFSGN